MLRKLKLGLFLIWVLLTLQSCGFMFNEAVRPNHCKKCEVIDRNGRNVVWEDQGCGGDMTNIEDNAKIEAYERNENSGNFQYSVECETWKKEEDEEN